MKIVTAGVGRYAEVRAFYHSLIDAISGPGACVGWQKDVYPAPEFLAGSLRRGELYLAEADGTVAGAMVLNRECNEAYPDTGWPSGAGPGEFLVIHALGVHPAFSRRGYAKALVRRALETAGALGMKAVRLDVLEGNVPAERLYAGCGFVRTGAVQMYYEDTGWKDFTLYEYRVPAAGTPEGDPMKIAIRPWEEGDSAALAALLDNPRILKNLRDGLPYPYTEKDAADYIRAMRSADPNDTFAFAVTLDGAVIGSAGVFRRDNIHRRTAELGYYLGEPYWGRGYMTQAVQQVCARVFEGTDILRIFAEPFARNAASCRVLEKAGFACEGVMRSMAFKDGEVLDMKLYALVREP